MKTKKRPYDPELLAISGSTEQYMIDVQNFVERALLLENSKNGLTYVNEPAAVYAKSSKKKKK